MRGHTWRRPLTLNVIGTSHRRLKLLLWRSPVAMRAMTDANTPDLVTPKQHALIADIFSELPDDPQQRIDSIKAIRNAFYEELARQMSPALNAYVRTMPQNSPEDFKQVAAWVNDLLRETHLRVKEPTSGLPSLIIADVHSGKRSQLPRYRIEAHRPNMRSVRSNTTYGRLFDVELMPAPTRVETWTRSYRTQQTETDSPPSPER